MKKTWRLPELTTKAKVAVGLIIVVFVGGLAAFVALSVINGRIIGSSADSQDFTKKDTTMRKTDALTSADTALKAGDENKASSIYDNAIAAEPDKTRKVKLAIDQSQLLYSNGKSDEAIAAAKKAEDYGSDKYLIADWLGQLYEVTKQYDNAVTYYTLAGTLVTSPTNDKGYDKKYYTDKVTALKALAEKG